MTKIKLRSDSELTKGTPYCVLEMEILRSCTRPSISFLVGKSYGVFVDFEYNQTSNISGTKSPNLNVSHLILQLSLPNEARC